MRAVRAGEKNSQGTNCIRKYSQNLKVRLEFHSTPSYTLLLIIIFLNVRTAWSNGQVQILCRAVAASLEILAN
jgi:hypothetical protein